MKKKCNAILLMGGRGERFGSSLPKQFHSLSGKKVYRYALDALIESRRFDEIVVVCHEEFIDEVKKEVQGCRIVRAGRTRQDSSYAGLCACSEDTDYVLIHDGVRPFLTKRMIDDNLSALDEYAAVDTCIPSADTIVRSLNGVIESIPDRKEYLRGQTPQSFHYDVILKAHEKAQGLNASDDCQLIRDHKIKVVLGDELNLKITSGLDLFLAEQILRTRRVVVDQVEGSLKGQRIAVTGGGGGIGKEICELLRAEGAEPIVIGLNRGDYIGDLSCGENAHLFFERIGLIDGLINCVGYLQRKALDRLDLPVMEKMIGSNYAAVLFSCRFAKVRPGGHIVNVASSSYAHGRGDYAIYSSSKAAVVNFTQALAQERRELYINVVTPQRTDTEMRKREFPSEDPETLLSASDVASEVVNLLKAKVTGAIVEVKKVPEYKNCNRSCRLGLMTRSEQES